MGAKHSSSFSRLFLPRCWAEQDARDLFFLPETLLRVTAAAVPQVPHLSGH